MNFFMISFKGLYVGKIQDWNLMLYRSYMIYVDKWIELSK